MGQTPHREDEPSECLIVNETAETLQTHKNWAERVLLVGLKRSGKTLFLQNLHPNPVLNQDLFESFSGKVLLHILKAMKLEFGNLDELMKIVKSCDENGEKISMNLKTFIELHVEISSMPVERQVSSTDLLLDLWKFRIFSDFYYENMDRNYFNENLEIFIENLRQYRVDGKLFDPFRIISNPSRGYTEIVKELDGNLITVIENSGTRPDKKLNVNKVIVLTVSLVDCMITVKDKSHQLNLSLNIPQMKGKFNHALSFFEDIVNSGALKSFRENTRLCVLFTKADLLMKRLEKFETFPRHEKEECNIARNDEISSLRNSFMERHVINYVVNEFNQIILKNPETQQIEFDYHIINALNQEESNQAFNLIVKPLNQRGVLKHFLSPCLFRSLEFLPFQMFHNLKNDYFIDVIIRLTSL